MSGSFTFILALLPLISQVSAFGACDPAIIANINNAGLTPFPQPKVAVFANRHAKYDFVCTTDAATFQRGELIFSESDNKSVVATVNRYLDGSLTATGVNVTLTENGDAFGVDYSIAHVGFIDNVTSSNLIYIWPVSATTTVVYYCSLDMPETDLGSPQFVIITPVDNCVISQDDFNAAEASILLANGNVPVPLSKMVTPPTSQCDSVTVS